MPFPCKYDQKCERKKEKNTGNNEIRNKERMRYLS